MPRVVRPRKVAKQIWHVPSRFSLHMSKVICKGSFGPIISARDDVEEKKVAIKSFSDCWENVNDLIEILKDIMAMKLLGDHQNIARLVHAAYYEPKEELYMMLPYCEFTLDTLLKGRSVFTERTIKRLAIQLLGAVSAMHGLNVAHCDIRPHNILITKQGLLQLTGLKSISIIGTLRSHDADDRRRSFIVNRWYSAPETMLNSLASHTTAVDLFSAGCVIAEMFTRSPLFPGHTYLDQMIRMFQLLGYSADTDLGFPMEERCARFIRVRCIHPGRPLAEVIPTANPAALDLLSGLLRLAPAARTSADAAIRHPYLQDERRSENYRNPLKNARRPPLDLFIFERVEHTVEQLRDRIQREIACFQDPEEVEVEGGKAGGPLFYPLSFR